ncbi:MAG: hypothetical protein K2M84_06800 [Anaeroplasmataceae bacterium]|nr:hypothetical protein [Anaeroplasmataceae bacterium]MDE7385450.1 hypothetical protein [Anaeroplasmataceae bacterium]
MTRFLKKNAKLFYILFAVFSFLFIILSCVFMTTYSRIAVDYTEDFLISGKPTVLIGLNTFCINTGISYAEIYGLMFDVNAVLQNANNMMLYLGAVSLVMSAIMFICTNATRKKYYISNLVSGVVCPSVCIIMSIITIVFIILCVGEVNANYDLLNWGSLANGDYYNRAVEQFKAGDTSAFSVNATPLIIFIVIIALFIVASGAMIAYAVYRYLDTRKELSNVVEEEVNADITEDDTKVELSERMVDANV